MAIPCYSSAFALHLDSSSTNTDLYYQTDNGYISAAISNDDYSETKSYIKEVTIQFDWQSQNDAFRKEIDRNIVSGGSAVYDIPFVIPAMADVGSHTYTVNYTGLQNDTHTLGLGTLYIHDIHEKIYQNLKQKLQSQFLSNDYQSSSSKSYLSQAKAYFSQAESLASHDEFVNGIIDLNSAQNSLNKANSEEQSWVSSHQILENDSSHPSNPTINSQSLEYEIYVIIALIGVGMILMLRGTEMMSNGGDAMMRACRFIFSKIKPGFKATGEHYYEQNDYSSNDSANSDLLEHYHILGLKPGASKDEIKKAHHELSKKFHPDKHGGSEFFNEFQKKLNTAYDALLNTK